MRGLEFGSNSEWCVRVRVCVFGGGCFGVWLICTFVNLGVFGVWLICTFVSMVVFLGVADLHICKFACFCFQQAKKRKVWRTLRASGRSWWTSSRRSLSSSECLGSVRSEGALWWWVSLFGWMGSRETKRKCVQKILHGSLVVTWQNRRTFWALLLLWTAVRLIRHHSCFCFPVLLRVYVELHLILQIADVHALYHSWMWMPALGYIQFAEVLDLVKK